MMRHRYVELAEGIIEGTRAFIVETTTAYGSKKDSQMLPMQELKGKRRMIGRLSSPQKVAR